jgi:hypothetical protein
VNGGKRYGLPLRAYAPQTIGVSPAAETLRHGRMRIDENAPHRRNAFLGRAMPNHNHLSSCQGKTVCSRGISSKNSFVVILAARPLINRVFSFHRHLCKRAYMN